MNHNFFNLSKRKKRDLLSDLLIGKEREGIISKKELIALKRIIGESAATSPTPAMGSPEKKSVRKTSVSGRKRGQKKKKTTIYLSADVLKNLNKAEKKIQKSGKGKNLPRITRSQIVDQALSMILDEFVSEGKNSRLIQKLLQER